MTTKSEFFKKLEAEVTCPLCLGVFVEPKKLPCEHVYCRACLHGLALRSTNKAISCPECRRDEPIPDDYSVDHFITPYRVNRQIEMYQDILKSTEEAATSPQPVTCNTHNSQPLDLYCETCEKLVCTHCVIQSCTKKNHNHGYIDEMVKRYESDLDRKLQPAKTLHRNIATALEAISTSERELLGAKEVRLLEIQTSFDALVEVLEKEKLYFTKNLEKSFQEQESLFSAKRRELSESLDNLESVLQSTESSLRSQSKTAFLSGIGDMKNGIEQSVKVASEASFSLHPERLPEMEYELLKLEELRELCHTKNFVYTKSDPLKCHIERSVNINDIRIDQPSTISLCVNSSNVNKGIFRKLYIAAKFLSTLDDSSQTVAVKKITSEMYSLTFEPHQSGKHELVIKYLDSVTCRIPICVPMQPGMLLSKKVNGAEAIKCYKGNVFTCGEDLGIAVLDPSSLNIKKVINTTPGCNELLIDSSHIYVTNYVDHKVIKMDMNGSVVASTGSQGNGPGEFNCPNGIRLSKDSEIFVCDSNNHRIQVFDKDLNLIRILGRNGDNRGCFNTPDDLDFDEDGNIFVIEQNNCRIQVLTPVGEHIRYIGGRGRKPGDLFRPCSPAIHRGFIYVTDIGNERISVFKTTGEFVTTFGEGKLFDLYCIAIDDDGYLYVTHGRSHVKKFYIPSYI